MSHLKSVHLKNVHLKYVLSKICPSKKRRGALSMTSQSIKLKLGKQVCSDLTSRLAHLIHLLCLLNKLEAGFNAG